MTIITTLPFGAAVDPQSAAANETAARNERDNVRLLLASAQAGVVSVEKRIAAAKRVFADAQAAVNAWLKNPKNKPGLGKPAEIASLRSALAEAKGALDSVVRLRQGAATSVATLKVSLSKAEKALASAVAARKRALADAAKADAAARAKALADAKRAEAAAKAAEKKAKEAEQIAARTKSAQDRQAAAEARRQAAQAQEAATQAASPLKITLPQVPAPQPGQYDGSGVQYPGSPYYTGAPTSAPVAADNLADTPVPSPGIPAGDAPSPAPETKSNTGMIIGGIVLAGAAVLLISRKRR